jgi:hypothetical protein
MVPIALQVDLLFDTLLPENVVATAYPLLES